MSTRRALERRLLAALDGVPRRIPFVLGSCGSGRTTLLTALHEQRGARACQYIDVERSATTPERFYRAVISTSPFRTADSRPITSPREAFQAVVAFLTFARTEDGAPATFLLDEVLEFRTFESFPGLRGLIADLFAALAKSENAFVLTSRYAKRAERLLRDPGPFLVIRMPPLSETDTRDALAAAVRSGASPAAAAASSGGAVGGAAAVGHPDAPRIVQALADGRAAYVRYICDQMTALARDGGADPISALTALLGSDGRLSARCGFCYELRLHRARGYGALKAILDILAQENPLTLTEIAQRLHRTPGSTKDYLSWLEDVDLVAMERKRYTFTDPILKLWVRLHCRPVPPHEEEVAREVQRYALERLARLAEALQASA
jgi:DNA-binding MarR family transcriptional regulator